MEHERVRGQTGSGRRARAGAKGQGTGYQGSQGRGWGIIQGQRGQAGGAGRMVSTGGTAERRRRWTAVAWKSRKLHDILLEIEIGTNGALL